MTLVQGRARQQCSTLRSLLQQCRRRRPDAHKCRDVAERVDNRVLASNATVRPCPACVSLTARTCPENLPRRSVRSSIPRAFLMREGNGHFPHMPASGTCASADRPSPRPSRSRDAALVPPSGRRRAPGRGADHLEIDHQGVDVRVHVVAPCTVVVLEAAVAGLCEGVSTIPLADPRPTPRCTRGSCARLSASAWRRRGGRRPRRRGRRQVPRRW